jgi:Na+/melibiose symporter-like transporter
MKNKNSLNYLDFVKTPVILSIAMIIAGLVVALKSSEVAWILIGVSVLALGVFQLFSAVSSVREDLRKSKIIKNPFGDKNKFKDSYDIKNKDYIQKNSDDDGLKKSTEKMSLIKPLRQILKTFLKMVMNMSE